jgi:Ca-activated chloride channel homolog
MFQHRLELQHRLRLRPRITLGLLIVAFLAVPLRVDAQTQDGAAQSNVPYRLSVSVNEVSFTFHAAGAHGLPIRDLRQNELRILDNGTPPRRVVSFQSIENFPIRAGILMDTSESMEGYRSRNRAISIEYAQRLLRQQTDQAFVMNFDSQSRVVLPWTSDATALTAGVRRFIPDGNRHPSGTAIFDSIYRACLNQFGRLDHGSSANFILLFSDGEDNASHASLQDAVDTCQRTNTAIYVFRAEPETSLSTGPKALAELASKSGGRVFHDDDSDEGIYSDLQIMEGNLRDQYRLIYQPAELKRDGSFHRIELEAPKRVDSITIRAGYYAPSR